MGQDGFLSLLFRSGGDYCGVQRSIHNAAVVFLSLLFRSGGDYKDGKEIHSEEISFYPFYSGQGEITRFFRTMIFKGSPGFYPFYSGQGEITDRGGISIQKAVMFLSLLFRSGGDYY